MAVILETSLGDLTIDLMLDQAPRSCANFLKLCKLKYYNFSPIHTVQPNFSLQTGDPIGPGSKDSDGGSSIWGLLELAATSRPSKKKTYTPEFPKKFKHNERGTVSMATAPSPSDPDIREAGSQFLITLGDNIDYLDNKAAPFGRVVEGFDTLEKINAVFTDNNGRPLKDIRIRHTIVLDEADVPDPPDFVEPPASPPLSAAQLATVRIADDEDLTQDSDPAALKKLRREREARAQALTLEMVGDLPFAEVTPPENVLFVCKLNPVTRDEDLELIFSRFGTIFSCEVIRDKRTGDSLQYAFVEFSEREACERAYHKMQNVLVDDHRIHVDFSQSVSRLADVWRDGANGKRKRQTAGGGFGGVEELEKKRQYRSEEYRPVARDLGGKGMVLDERHRQAAERDDGKKKYRPGSGSRSPAGKRRNRSRSPRRYHDDHHDRRRRYSTSPSPPRHRHVSRERHRHRDRGRA